MAPTEIRDKFRAKPFRPLRVYASDGTTYVLTKASQAYVSMMEVLMAFDPNEHDVPTRSVRLTPEQVTRIEELPIEILKKVEATPPQQPGTTFMAPQDIYKKIKAKPFLPIRIHVSDGATYDLFDRDYAYMTSPTELAIGIEPDEAGVPMRSIYIASNHVTRIVPLASEAEKRA